MAALTDKKRRLCHRVVESGDTNREAYRHVYGSNNTDGSADVAVCRILKEPEVIEYLEFLRHRALERHDRNVDYFAKQFDEDRQFARENLNPSAAVQATTNAAKLYGHMVQKHDVNIGFRPGEAREYVKAMLSKYADRVSE